MVGNQTRPKKQGKKELGEWYSYMKQEDGGQYTTRPERDSLFLRPEEDWNFNSRKRKKKLLRATKIFQKVIYIVMCQSSDTYHVLCFM